MARKQSLANKQRSQKRRDKKRARTIRSMRQVNGGGGFLNKLKRSLGLGKSSNLPSEVNTPLLENTPLLANAPLLSEQSSVLQPLLASSSVPSPSVTDDEDFDNISEQEYDDTLFNICLNKIVNLCVVDPRLCVVDRTLQKYNETNSPNSKKRFKEIIHQKVIDTITNFTSEKATESFDTTYETFTAFLTKLENENVKNLKKNMIVEMRNTTKLIMYLNMLWSELSLYAKKIIKMNMTEMNMTEMNMKMTKKYLIFVAMHTFNEIFNNNKTHFTEDTLTAGGSKGKMKSKMRRPKSRTRKS